MIVVAVALDAAVVAEAAIRCFRRQRRQIRNRQNRCDPCCGYKSAPFRRAQKTHGFPPCGRFPSPRPIDPNPAAHAKSSALGFRACAAEKTEDYSRDYSLAPVTKLKIPGGGFVQ